jgi:hypothetical protein
MILTPSEGAAGIQRIERFILETAIKNRNIALKVRFYMSFNLYTRHCNYSKAFLKILVLPISKEL